jgi:hypothetical protein
MLCSIMGTSVAVYTKRTPDPAGVGGDARERVGPRVAPVRAGVAEHDHRRARVQVVLDPGEELAPHPVDLRLDGA